MPAHALVHLRDEVLLRDLAALVARDRATTAALLAHLGEVDARRLYAPAGYESMHAYCVDELHFSEDSAYKRIQAARAARKCPALLPALAEGRLHLTAIVFLAPHLTPENADDLIAGATHRRKADIQNCLAQRFPQAPPPSFFTSQRLPTPVVGELVPEPVADHVPAPAVELSRVVEAGSIPDESVLLKIRVARSTHDKLRDAQALLSHVIPSGDEAAVLDRALDALIARCEKRKFAATAVPRARRRPTSAARHVPSHVKRAVWDRDQGRCTFVGDTGHRCGSRRFLEFDHVDPVARGGRPTVDGMRLRCRTHNQYEAERSFGAGFMERKRAEARQANGSAADSGVSSADARARHGPPRARTNPGT